VIPQYADYDCQASAHRLSILIDFRKYHQPHSFKPESKDILSNNRPTVAGTVCAVSQLSAFRAKRNQGKPLATPSLNQPHGPENAQQTMIDDR
jgi:hypothetical protein